MEKVVVGMSGGVDSAAAAYLLKKAGYDVIGVTLRTWQADDGSESRCCDIDDARSTAQQLGIRYVPVNCTADFQRFVVDPFAKEYLRGRTPNPCIICNRCVKWEKLLYYARVVGAAHIATGHYASVIKLDNGRYTVKQAAHSEKDQAYMLYRLTQEQLAATLMPLGDLSKEEVRQIAEDAGLSVASKPDSQEVCFVTDGSYADYIEKTAGDDFRGEGSFVDPSGNILAVYSDYVEEDGKWASNVYLERFDLHGNVVSEKKKVFRSDTLMLTDVISTKEFGTVITMQHTILQLDANDMIRSEETIGEKYYFCEMLQENGKYYVQILAYDYQNPENESMSLSQLGTDSSGALFLKDYERD